MFCVTKNTASYRSTSMPNVRSVQPQVLDGKPISKVGREGEEVGALGLYRFVRLTFRCIWASNFPKQPPSLPLSISVSFLYPYFERAFSGSKRIQSSWVPIVLRSSGIPLLPAAASNRLLNRRSRKGARRTSRLTPTSHFLDGVSLPWCLRE